MPAGGAGGLRTEEGWGGEGGWSGCSRAAGSLCRNGDMRLQVCTMYQWQGATERSRLALHCIDDVYAGPPARADAVASSSTTSYTQVIRKYESGRQNVLVCIYTTSTRILFEGLHSYR